jgi:hypothetical protein
MIKKRKKKEKSILGIGWYKENQWDLLLRHAVDKEDLEPTYADWLEGISASIAEISNSQIQCVKIHVDVEEMIKWCKDNDYPFDGASRAVYISLKTKEKFC